MKRIALLLLSLGLVAGFSLTALAAGPEITPEVRQQLEQETAVLKQWAAEPAFINAVKTQNAEGLSLDEIKRRDAAWRQAAGAKKENDLIKACLNHPVGEWLSEKNKEGRGRYPEAFLTDNQGANVAMSKATSDYWQGDEEKWTESFADGSGNVYYGQPELDESSRAMLVQVSVPVMDAGQAIGVLVVGIRFSSLK